MTARVVTMHDLLAVLQGHVGRKRGASVQLLAHRLDTTARHVRQLVTDLRNDGVAVCGHPHDGYYIAETPEELEQTCKFLRSRALHSLTLEAKLRKVPLADLLGQMKLKT